MNERIRELALQAGLSHMPSNYPDMADLYKGADFELAKFAELIVRECADVLITEMNRLDSLHRVVAAQTMDTAQVLIKQHFGVEE